MALALVSAFFRTDHLWVRIVFILSLFYSRSNVFAWQTAHSSTQLARGCFLCRDDGGPQTGPQPGAFSLKASFAFSIQKRSSVLPREKQKETEQNRRTIDRRQKRMKNRGGNVNFYRWKNGLAVCCATNTAMILKRGTESRPAKGVLISKCEREQQVSFRSCCGRSKKSPS